MRNKAGLKTITPLGNSALVTNRFLDTFEAVVWSYKWLFTLIVATLLADVALFVFDFHLALRVINGLFWNQVAASSIYGLGLTAINFTRYGMGPVRRAVQSLPEPWRQQLNPAFFPVPAGRMFQYRYRAHLVERLCRDRRTLPPAAVLSMSALLQRVEELEVRREVERRRRWGIA